MKNTVMKNIHHLKILGSCKSKLRKAILKNSESDLILTICECILNILHGNVKTTENVTQKLVNFKKTLR